MIAVKEKQDTLTLFYFSTNYNFLTAKKIRRGLSESWMLSLPDHSCNQEAGDSADAFRARLEALLS